MAKRRGNTKAKKPANVRSQSLVEDVSEDYVSGSDNEDMESLHSDALDEEYDDAEKTKKHRRIPSKRAQNPKHKPATRSTDSKGAPEKRTPVRKKRKVAEDEHESDVELKDGQEVVGKVVEAPTTGWGAHIVPSRTLFATHGPLDSARRPDISAYAGFPDTHERPGVQRSRLVSIYTPRDTLAPPRTVLGF